VYTTLFDEENVDVVVVVLTLDDELLVEDPVDVATVVVLDVLVDWVVWVVGTGV
jgi:hypothetical protein